MAVTGHWHHRFIGLAQHHATWSRDPSTHVGAVIVDASRRIVSVGYNGPPRGTDDTLRDREQRLLRTIHAETNAILFARRDLAGCALYVTHHPCAHCAAVIIQSGLKQVCMPPVSAAFRERWYASVHEAAVMFREAGVTVSTVWPESNE